MVVTVNNQLEPLVDRTELPAGGLTLRASLRRNRIAMVVIRACRSQSQSGVESCSVGSWGTRRESEIPKRVILVSRMVTRYDDSQERRGKVSYSRVTFFSVCMMSAISSDATQQQGGKGATREGPVAPRRPNQLDPPTVNR